MKGIFLIIFCMAVTPALCQNINEPYFQTEPKRTYIGVAGGINYSGYCAFSVEQNFKGKSSIVGSAGLEPWGLKITVGGRYYLTQSLDKSITGKGISVNCAFVSGLQKIEIDLNTSTGMQRVNLQLYQVNALNLTYFSSRQMGSSATRFGWEIGYSISFNSGDAFRVLDKGVVLSRSEIRLLRFMQPGGLIFGISFTFGR